MPRLSKLEPILRGPDGKEFAVLGLFRSKMSTTTDPGRSSQQIVYVLLDLRLPLLGRPAIQDLQIFTEVDAVSTYHLTDSQVYSVFSSLFTGLGKFSGPPYQTRLRDDAVPYSLTTPRRVPIPMIERVATELRRMETFGIIRKVDELTD